MVEVEYRLLQVFRGSRHLADASLDSSGEGLGGEGHRGTKAEHGEEIVYVRDLKAAELQHGSGPKDCEGDKSGIDDAS